MLKKIFYISLLTIVIIACSSDDNSDNNSDNTDNFDRRALLVNVADNIIIPSFEDLQLKLNALETARATFDQDKTQGNLDALSAAWLNAYKVWQYVEMFNLGEAENLSGGAIGFVSFFNVYPVTTNDVDQGAISGNYDLTTSNYHDAQGFAALDYLIHGITAGDSTALDKFTSNVNATGFNTYMKDVIDRMNMLTSNILSNWQSTFRDTFVSNTSSGINGSLNKLTNDFIFFYEKGFRANKIGIPAGNFSNQPLPEKVEAFYKKDVSKELALNALDAIQDFFEGRSYNGGSIQGESLKSYLEFLGRTDIANSLTNQFSDASSSINALNNNFFDQVSTNNNQMILTYDVIQAAVPIMKIDMVQVFGVTIDFVDADGD